MNTYLSHAIVILIFEYIFIYETQWPIFYDNDGSLCKLVFFILFIILFTLNLILKYIFNKFF